MRDDNKKIVRELRKIHQEEVSKFRKKKEQKLYNLCLALGGHDFYIPQKILIECVDPELNHFVEVRHCSCCGFREEQMIEEAEKSFYELGQETALEEKAKPCPRDISLGFDLKTDSLHSSSKRKNND